MTTIKRTIPFHFPKERLDAYEWFDTIRPFDQPCSSVSPFTQKYSCFWDRHPIDGPIVRCPVSQQPLPVEFKYNSLLNGNTYTIQDQINSTEWVTLVDGAFCSASCCLAFAQDQTHPLFIQSEVLIRQDCPDVHPAPHWRCLREYGGELTIEQFRTNLSKTYTFQGTFVKPVVMLFKEIYSLSTVSKT
jgi:hypothetical protein